MAEGLPLLGRAELNSADPCGSAHLMVHPPNFHSWAIVTATDPHSSTAQGVFRLLLSIFVILTQIFVLALMIRESDNARCLDNESCPSGTAASSAAVSECLLLTVIELCC